MENFQVDIEQVTSIGYDLTAFDSTNFHNNMNNCSTSSSMGKLDYFRLKLKHFLKEARWQTMALV